ncbi:MAG: DUF1934 domain-containing protein [Lachnospiraceae bacterium]|nr:DUF1934 domain-containing protein [Lachnospiraceae bacterium]
MERTTRIPVTVSLEIQRSDGEKQETEKIAGPGYFYEADGIRFLVYETGEGLRQQIELWPEKAIVRTPVENAGAENCMVFRMGERLAAEYHTPYGSLHMETRTREYRTEAREEFRVWLTYELYLDGGFVSECRMQITAKRRS